MKQKRIGYTKYESCSLIIPIKAYGDMEVEFYTFSDLCAKRKE